MNLAKNHRLPRKLLGILISSAILIAIYLIALLIEGITIRGVIVFGQLVLVIIFYLYRALLSGTKKDSNYANITAIFALNFSLFAISDFATPFKSFTGNSNVFGSVLFLAFFHYYMPCLLNNP